MCGVGWEMMMSPALQVILSGCLSFGIPLLIALYELRNLRRYRGGDRGGWRRPAPVRPPVPSGGGDTALPACLVPNEQWRAPARRMRELA